MYKSDLQIIKSIISIYVLILSFSEITLGQTFSPKSLLGLRLWFSSDSGITESNGRVSGWADLSSNGNDATQLVVMAQPLFVDSIKRLNNKPILRFNGNGEYLTFPETTDIRTIFWVIKEDSDATSNARALLGHHVLYDFHRGDNQEFWRPASTNINIQNGETRIGPLVVDGTSTKLPENYALITVLTIGDVSASNFSWDQNFSTRFWDGDLAELIIYNQPLSNSDRLKVEQYLRYKYAPPVNLGADITVNYGFCATKLNAHKDWFTSYAWSTSQTTDSILPDKSGEYSVSVTDIFGYPSSDTIKITYPGNLHPFPDTTICYGDTLVWNTQLNKIGYSFLWQDNSTDSLFKITQAGQYYVTVTDTIGVSGCSAKSYTLNVTVNNFPQTTSLGADKSMCSGESLYLSSGAGQAVSYLWSTGATTSSIAITTTGTYSVTVQNSMGCTARDTIDINIKGVAPIAGFLSPSVCFGSAFSFTDTSSVIAPDKIALWNWNFGDGSPTNTLQNPTHSYTTAGTFTVALSIVSDSGCTAQITKPVTINAKPNANFSSAIACSGSATQFFDQSSVINSSINQWAWDFGDPLSSNNTASVKNPQHTYSLGGTYTVTLITTAASSCKDTVTNSILVNQSPKASFISSNVCIGKQTVFQNTSTGNINSWQWNFGDFTPVSPQQNPTHIYASAGTYSVALLVQDLNGCSNTIIDSAVVYYVPVPKFTPDSTCLNSVTQLLDKSTVVNSTINLWNWNFSSFGTSTLQNPATTYTSTGTYSITLTVASAQTCTATITKTITVLPIPVADFTFSPTFGAPPLAVLFNSSASSSNTYSYLWDFGNGSQSSVPNPLYTYNDTGFYSITLVAATKFGCKDSIKDTLRVAIPKLDAAVKAINTINSNTIKVSALLYNAGTLDITNLELVAYLDNGTHIHESWSGKLQPYSFITYKFNSSFENENNKHNVICIEVVKVNYIDDDVSSNNRSCAAVSNDFALLDPFPNPAETEVYFLFTLPANKHIKAQVLDADGRLIEIIMDEEMPQGLNTIKYNIIPLRKGMYILKFVYDNSIIKTKKFIKK